MATILQLSVGEPFASPTWGSNLAVFSSDTGAPIAEENTKEYLSRACRYAKKFGVYLVPERFMMLGNQSMALIGPEGKVIGAQQGIFENPDVPVLHKSSKVEVWDTPFGGIFLAVDVDIYRPEVGKLAQSMGAHFVIASQYLTKAQYSSHRVVAGVWSVAQSNRLFVIGVSGEYHGVCAPKELTPKKDGFVVAPTMRMPITAKLSADLLLRMPARSMLSRRFYATHRKEILGEHALPGI